MITGQMFRDGVISGANNIANSRQAVDALNIFPVPDGDTGTNMSMTIASAADEVKDLPDDVALCDVAKKTAGALLRGARGKFGALFCLLFSEASARRLRVLKRQGARMLPEHSEPVRTPHTRRL